MSNIKGDNNMYLQLLKRITYGAGLIVALTAGNAYAADAPAGWVKCGQPPSGACPMTGTHQATIGKSDVFAPYKVITGAFTCAAATFPGAPTAVSWCSYNPATATGGTSSSAASSVASSSVASSVASSAASSVAGGAPSAPLNLLVPPLAFDNTKILVTWDKPATGSPTGYKIYVGGVLKGTVTTKSYTKLTYSTPTAAPTASTSAFTNLQLYYELTGLTASTSHAITVKAYNASGESAASNTVTQSTTAAPATITITDAAYGAATGNTAAVNTKKIQAAIHACAVGGKVVFPAGVFKSGALYLKSDCTYEINGTLQGSDVAADYEFGNNRFANYGANGFGTVAYHTNYKSLLNTCGKYTDWTARTGYTPDNMCNDKQNIRITGTGSIIGSGGGAATTDSLNSDYVLTALSHAQRAVYGGATDEADKVRADLITLLGVKGLYIGGLKIAYPANHTIFIGRSSNITMVNLNVSAMQGSKHMHNGDGVDLSTAWASAWASTGPTGLLPTNAHIIGSVWDTGDDCINLNAGDALPGKLNGGTVNGVYVKNNLTLAGHGGVVLGSFTAAGFKNIYVTENTFDGTEIGLRMKTDLKKGGGIAPLSGSDVGVLAVDNRSNAVTKAAISILGSYSGTTVFADAGAPGQWKDITIKGWTGSTAALGITTTSNSGYENLRIKMTNVNITGTKGHSILGTKGTPAETMFTNVTSSGGTFVYTSGMLTSANFSGASPTPAAK